MWASMAHDLLASCIAAHGPLGASRHVFTVSFCEQYIREWYASHWQQPQYVEFFELGTEAGTQAYEDYKKKLGRLRGESLVKNRSNGKRISLS